MVVVNNKDDNFVESTQSETNWPAPIYRSIVLQPARKYR